MANILTDRKLHAPRHLAATLLLLLLFLLSIILFMLAATHPVGIGFLLWIVSITLIRCYLAFIQILRPAVRQRAIVFLLIMLFSISIAVWFEIPTRYENGAVGLLTFLFMLLPNRPFLAIVRLLKLHAASGT